MKKEQIVATADVGRRKTMSEKHTICFHIHDFENLSDVRGDFVTSPSLQCHGLWWSLRIYPGGDCLSDQTEKNISLYLRNDRSKGETAVKFSFRVDSAGFKRKIATKIFTAKDSWGCKDFTKRDDVLDRNNEYLVNGTLTVKVDIQIFQDTPPDVWIPTKTLHRDLLDMLQSAKSADVTFVTGGERFHAHRLLLTKRAPALSSLVEDVPQDVDVPIDNVDPRVFQALLHFIYSDELPSTFDLKKNARGLLEAADMFGCFRLKLIAEAEIAACGISVENAAELLLLAESKNCALLKEAALAFFAANRDAVMASRGFSVVEESAEVMKVLMRVLVKPVALGGDDTKVDAMSVATLRRKLDEKGLDVDGTREILVKRLKTSSTEHSASCRCQGL